jgi:hypothetical protein
MCFLCNANPLSLPALTDAPRFSTLRNSWVRPAFSEWGACNSGHAVDFPTTITITTVIDFIALTVNLMVLRDAWWNVAWTEMAQYRSSKMCPLTHFPVRELRMYEQPQYTNSSELFRLFAYSVVGISWEFLYVSLSAFSVFLSILLEKLQENWFFTQVVYRDVMWYVVWESQRQEGPRRPCYY